MTTGITNTSQQTFAASTTQSTTNNNEIGKDQFLQLLTYQLKSQDPMQPYNNQEFAAQLAQFSQLEQLTDIRSLMEQQLSSNQSLSKTITNSALPGMLGKSARATSSNVFYDGTTNPSLGFTLSSAAVSGELVIKNAAGKVVRNIKLDSSQLASGDNSLTWDGKDNSGNTLSQGKYTFAVNALDKSGASITADGFVSGKIQAVKFKAEGTVLVINGMEIPLENILDVTT